MDKIFSAINFFLVFIIVLLLGLSVKTWTHPKFPSRVEESSIATLPKKKIAPVRLQRRTTGLTAVQQIVQKNLFRKERLEPRSPVQVGLPRPQVSLPHPNIQLKGVVLTGESKIALLEGTYSVREANGRVQNKKIKKKGYYLGDQVGKFKVSDIKKKFVTLRSSAGEELRLKLERKPSQVSPRRRVVPPARKPVQPPGPGAGPTPPQRVQPPQHISGLATGSHISGGK